ncbi:hypothetical protein [Aquabacterium sp.]|uniref:hypothetical protein n=1 Tax=Aquabacterium sp. TaxID=1872578 RepID=UPI003D6D0B33
MNLDIEHLAITLQGVSPDLGGRVKDLLAGELNRRLSELKLRTATTDIAQADLGPIQGPAGADAQALTDLIATQLIGWIERQETH